MTPCKERLNMTDTTHTDGGPAFPMWDRTYPGEADSGMSLRDWFAGQAMAGLLAKSRDSFVEWHEYASWAYGAADAMLAERERRRS
jgi:hypothetical protein